MTNSKTYLGLQIISSNYISNAPECCRYNIRLRMTEGYRIIVTEKENISSIEKYISSIKHKKPACFRTTFKK